MIGSSRSVAAAGFDSPGVVTPHLSGWKLGAARLAWGAVVLLTLSVFAANLALTFGRLRVLCVGAACAPGQLSPMAATTLEKALGLSVGAYAMWSVAFLLLPALVWFLVAAVIVWRKGDEWLALMFALQLVVQGGGHDDSVLQASNPLWHGAALVVNDLQMALLFAALALFPDGRFVPRWMGWVVLVASALVTFPAGNILYPLTLALLLGAQVYRYRCVSGPVQRQQSKWVLASSATVFLWELAVNVAALLVPALGRAGTLNQLGYLGQPGSLDWAASHALTPFVFVLVPLSIGVAVLRYRLWDIDALIHRALVYGVLTTCVIGIYVGSVGYLGALFRTGNNPAISLLANALVAVLFQPLRSRLQRGVSRLLYGERDDPYAVLARLGQRLEGTLAPETELPAIVETVAETLKLPYVAITLAPGAHTRGETDTGLDVDVAGDGGGVVAAYGAPVARSLRLPLVYQGESIGSLVLAPRAGEALGTRDLRLLADLARQAGVAAYAVRLTTDLQQARERLVAAREEERRRLCHDLHDGLGPTLAALTLKIGAARKLLPRDRAAADAILGELGGDIETTVGDIRRLVSNLRPPSLDEHGLIGAIHACIAQQALDGAGGPRVLFDAPASLPALPAAVEVAAYRIAQEALTNVVRHAAARACWIRVSLDGRLDVEIRDDGVGLAAARHRGVGLRSMRERAAEVGGTCVVEPGPAGGTRVLACLPVATE